MFSLKILRCGMSETGNSMTEYAQVARGESPSVSTTALANSQNSFPRKGHSEPEGQCLLSAGNCNDQSISNVTGDQRKKILHAMAAVPEALLSRYFTQQAINAANSTSDIAHVICAICRPGPNKRDIEQGAFDDCSEPALFLNDEIKAFIPRQVGAQMLDLEMRVRQAIYSFGAYFPPSIWTCCRRGCFALLACEPDQIRLLEEVLKIHFIADGLHSQIENVQRLVKTRRKGIGGSNLVYVAPSRQDRESDHATDRQKALKQLSEFTTEVIPFLRGQKDAPSGTKRPQNKLCTEAICCLLGVSKNFLYRRKLFRTESGAEDQLLSTVDRAGVRLCQYRRCGLRTGYPDINELPNFECGCDSPCLAEVPLWLLHTEYNEFSSIAQQLNPRKKENRYLLNVMFCPLLNSPLRYCDKSLANLYTISEGVISDVRMILERLCSDPKLDRKDFLNGGALG